MIARASSVMPIEFPTWPRSSYVADAGAPHLLLAAYGTLNLNEPIDRAKYRAAGVPAGLELLLYSRELQPRAFLQLQRSIAWGLAQAETPDLARIANAAPQCALLQGHVRDSRTLDYLRDAVGIVQYLFERGANTVFDPATYQFWNAKDWNDRLFAPAAAVPHEHVIILETHDDAGGGTWVHTRGLRKFGRPDLSVHGVGDHYRDRVTDLFNHYVDYFARGGSIKATDKIVFAGLPAGSVVKLDPSLDHPDFFNAHAEIVWPAGALLKS